MKKIYVAALLASTFMPMSSYAHGIIGDRIFPATLTVDDPFANDELALPTIQYFKQRNDDGTTNKQAVISTDYTKTITPDFALTVGADYLHNDTDGSKTNGFDNFEVGAAYQIYQNAEHEFALLGEFNVELGNSGSSQVGVDKFNTYTPTILFGKGFGDLPDTMPFLKPFAITGSFGYSLPDQRFTTSTDPDTGLLDRDLNARSFNWGGSIQYSIPYLEQHVKDVGITGIAAGLIPVVEFSMQTPTEGESSGKTTGTISPGVIWIGTKMQYGLEAELPINHDTGSGVGVIAQVHFFIDDIFPNSIGKPIFGDK